MNVGFIGLGKLGMPVAVCIAAAGHNVVGYDIDPQRRNKTNYPYEEVGRTKDESFQDMLADSSLKFADTPEDVIEKSDIIFLAIQTPHAPQFEGTVRTPSEMADFNYQYLIDALKVITQNVTTKKIVAIISTVAPGTYKNSLTSILESNPNVHYCYNPFFIAMGTVVTDFLNPEFVLLGSNNTSVLEKMTEFYATIHKKPILKMSISSAEIVKMSYNTMIGMKITFANNAMELCQVFGGNVDHVMGALKQGTDRLISTRYLSAGMGDGGGCHPRDCIVLSHLAKKHNLSCDLSGMMMYAREKQSEWLVDLLIENAKATNLPIIVLGRSFKPETNIETGSPSVLCINILKEKGFEVKSYEPFSDGPVPDFAPAVFLVGCKHAMFENISFPAGSVVLDPHRYIPQQPNVKVISLGISNES